MNPSTFHPSLRRKRPRYLTSWEESFARIPNPQEDERQPLISSSKNNNQFGLIDLFGRNRWVCPKEIRDHHKRPPNKDFTRKNHRLPNKKHTMTKHDTSSPCCKRSEFFTLRMEHRVGGALAKHVGEERILLFRSDRAGAIAKIIFSSNPAAECEEDEDASSSSERKSDCQQQQQEQQQSGGARIRRRRRRFTVAANAKVHVLFVKDDYRGFNLGGLLFLLCTTRLREKYSDRTKDLSSVCCLLDAEEDVRRHDKLVRFYEHLGFRACKRAKPLFINNNDGETYRRIPMKKDLLLSSRQESNAQPSNNSGQGEAVKTYASFLPAVLLSSMENYAKVNNRSIDSWLIVECQDGTVELRTTDGRVLEQDSEGRCSLVSTQKHSFKSGSVQLLRVSDTLNKVLWNRQDEPSTMDLLLRDKSLSPQRNEKEQNCDWMKEKELWMLRFPWNGRFLGMASDGNLIASPGASFWQVDENLRLTHTLDSPARRQHHRKMWETQSVAYVSKMQEKHSAFALCTMSIQDALDLTQHLLANPFSLASEDKTDSNARCLPSLRTLLFHTAELARKEGHPDWVQFVALVHGLAGALACTKWNACNTENSEFDWTIYVDSRVMGCKASEQSAFHEFRHLNPDKDDPRFSTTNGMYRENVGLETVQLSWTSGEYMYRMLKHNRVRLPIEAYAILKLFALVDWHKRGKHSSLSSEADEDARPFVSDFYELFERSNEAVTKNASVKEMSERECRQLWTNHYSRIANKYGAGGILEW